MMTRTATIPADDPDLLRNRPIPQRALVISCRSAGQPAAGLVVLFSHRLPWWGARRTQTLG